jgi:hypothetical protein
LNHVKELVLQWTVLIHLFLACCHDHTISYASIVNSINNRNTCHTDQLARLTLYRLRTAAE